MTNTSLQNALGVSAATVSRILAGHRVGSPEFILKVADVSGTDAGKALRAAVRARSGDTDEWIGIVRSISPTPEPEPETPTDPVDGSVS